MYVFHFSFFVRMVTLFNLQATDLLFCYRWLLLEMKREFAFDDALRMLEVTWSSLIIKPRQIDLSKSITLPFYIRRLMFHLCQVWLKARQSLVTLSLR